jgi:solute:Na+ symporter, SSS family
MMGFAVLGIYLVHDLFPNQAVLAQAADLIQQHAPGVTKAQWRELISNIINNQKDYSSLIPGLQSILGSDWNQKLFLVSFEGTVDPERILPAVMLYCIPMGMRGLMVVAMLSALMSTFSPCVNTPTGLLTRNLYHRYIRPQAKTKELIYISWFFIFLLVLLGFLFAYTLKSINDIWEWIIMGLMAGLMVPDILRFYWWRLNGSGYAIGIATGLTAAIVQRIVYPELKGPWLFSFMAVMGLAGTIIGTYLTQPTDRKVLEHFYRTTRPFGFWGPLKKILPDDVRLAMERENRNSILAVPFTLLWQVTLFILPMQLVIHAYTSFGITLVLFCVGLTGMYFLWYKNLPKKDS